MLTRHLVIDLEDKKTHQFDTLDEVKAWLNKQFFDQEFHESVKNPDGTLTSRFVRELETTIETILEGWVEDQGLLYIPAGS